MATYAGKMRPLMLILHAGLLFLSSGRGTETNDDIIDDAHFSNARSAFVLKYDALYSHISAIENIYILMIRITSPGHAGHDLDWVI